MRDTFGEKLDFIIRTDEILKDYIETVVIKNIKAELPDDAFKNMTTNHIQAALMLRNIGPCSLKEFAAVTRQSKAAASALVDRMVKLGAVEREINPDNRREVILRVSRDLEEHVNRVRTRMKEWFQALTSQIGEDTVDKWYEVMVELNQALETRMKSDEVPY